VHPLLALPYAALAGVAEALTHLPVDAEHKAWRAIRNRAGGVDRLVQWAREHRDRTRTLLWMHAPSVGEGLQARPVLERIRARHPQVQLLYTFYSPSAERFAQAMLAAGTVDATEYLPFDTTANATRLLDALAPTALVFAKLDVWPQLVRTAAARGVRLGLISATLSEGSGRGGGLARALLGDAYAALDSVGAIDAADATRLTALGVRADRVTALGDTRYDQVAARAAAADRTSALLAPLASERPTVVAGSTWPADEEVLLMAWLRVRKTLPNARLIIAPHEPTPAHTTPIRRWAQAHSIPLAMLSNLSAPVGGGATPEFTNSTSHGAEVQANSEAEVLLVDRVGVLGDLYALAQAAYVGGGFHAAGLHSVLEPAAFGAPVLFGPRHTRSRDALLLLEAKGAVAVSDVEELSDALQILLTEPDTHTRASRAAKAVVAQGVGAADRSTALVEGLLFSEK
jgi:3-deoxy-D-manno-octulosonic-acid transferase